MSDQSETEVDKISDPSPGWRPIPTEEWQCCSYELLSECVRHGMDLDEFIAFESLKALMRDQSGLAPERIGERSWQISDQWMSEREKRKSESEKAEDGE